MPRVKVGPASLDRKTLDGEIARLRDLDVGALHAGWRNVFRRQPPPHLPRHLMFRMLAYRLQANHLGDLDGDRHVCGRHRDVPTPLYLDRAQP
jgi:hypothetical protein